MNMPADRLKQARKNAGFGTAAEATERFGWKFSTYAGHENGSRGFKPSAASIYARAFGVTDAWLLFGDARSAMSQEQSTEVGNSLVSVYNVEASAGHGSIVGDDEQVIDRLAFPKGYLERITRANVRDLAIIGVKGESMVPTLHDDDIVMIDTSKRDLSYDGLFVIRDNGAGLLVKRIGRASIRGYITIIADNKNYPTVERSVDDIDVIGKVIWFGKKA